MKKWKCLVTDHLWSRRNLNATHHLISLFLRQPGVPPSANVEEFFRRLVEFSQSLNEEEQRGIRESLSEEELAIFDLLTKPGMKLTQKQEKEVKKIASELLTKLKEEKLVLDWRKRQKTQAGVRLCIEAGRRQLVLRFSDN